MKTGRVLSLICAIIGGTILTINLLTEQLWLHSISAFAISAALVTAIADLIVKENK